MIDWLSSHVPPFLVIALVSIGVVLGTVAYLILLERKSAAWFQDRLGPNRVGPWGLLQPMADGLKFLFKEDYRPAGVDKVLFSVAPALMMCLVLVALAVLPWGGIYQGTRTLALSPAPANLPQAAQQAARDALPLGTTLHSVSTDVSGNTATVHATYRFPLQIARINIGVLFIIAVLSLAVYGVVVGGWASNNKYSFLGGLRATAQMISYEIPLGLSLLAVVVMFGTLELGEIVERQAHYWAGFIPAWNVFTQPLGFLIFLVCIHAEANRAPFDLAEAEQELVGGYHTEYSSMRFALFFLSEYTGMIATSAVCVALFFGGWHFPGLSGPADQPAVTSSLGVALLRCAVYLAKVLVIILVFMWVRWSLPRFRFDQLMMLAWRSMIPISLALLLVTALVLYFAGPHSRLFVEFRRIDGRMALAMLFGNVVVLAGAMLLSRLLPAPPPTNRRLAVVGSRFSTTPEPTPTASAALD